MRISLVIESDSVTGFLEQLAELQAIPVGTLPAAKVIAHVAKLAQEQEPAKPAPAPVTPPPPSPEEPKPGPAPQEPAEEETPPAAAQAPAEAKKRRGRPKKAEPAEAAPAAPIEAVAAPAPANSNGKAVIFTRDDLTAAFKEYVVKFGYAAASSDVSKLLQQTFGAGVRKSSDVGDDHIADAIALVKQAVNDNPFKREVAANG